jgi:hypothetical protein
VDENWLKQKLHASPKRSATLNGVLVKQEKEMIEAALAGEPGPNLGTSRRGNQIRSALAHARLENQALENQQISVQGSHTIAGQCPS